MTRKTVSGIMLILLLIGVTSFTFYIQQASEQPITEWSQTYGGADSDEAFSMVQTVDGGYALAGWTRSFGAGDFDFLLVKTDSDGNMEWSQTYGGGSKEKATSVVQMVDGGYALAGWTRSFGAGSYDLWLVKTDSDGNMEWSQTYGGGNDDDALSVVETNDGGYALAGWTRSFGAGNIDFWLVKTDSDGNMEWSQTYGGADIDFGWSVVQTVDGGYALAGETRSFGSGFQDVWLVKIAGPPSSPRALELLAPWITLASLIIVAAMLVVYIKYRKKKQT